MIWRDVLLRGGVSIEEIGNALAGTFSLGAHEVRVSEDIADIGNQPVFSLLTPRAGGQFSVALTIYTTFDIEGSTEALARFAKLISREVLTSDDDSSNPYAVLIFDPQGRSSEARVVPEDLDERDEYNLSSEYSAPTDLGGSSGRVRKGVRAPDACPEPGFWFTPAQTNSRRYFKSGDVMPEVGGDYGATIWQWDQNQDPPKL
jgi:hypothetical protein